MLNEKQCFFIIHLNWLIPFWSWEIPQYELKSVAVDGDDLK